MKKNLRRLFYVILGVFTLSTVVRYIIIEKNRNSLAKYQERFTPITELGTFEESKQREYAPTQQYDEMVIFFHAYGAAPDTFNEVYKKLEAAGIPYYCPQIHGHGLEDTHLMEAITVKDWRRQSIAVYELVATFAKKVSVVGYSTGATFAVYLAGKHKIDHLILIDPAITPMKKEKVADKFLDAPFLGDFLKYTVPMVPIGVNKDNMTKNHGFAYTYYDMNSFSALYDLQKSVEIEKMRGNVGHINLLLMNDYLQVDGKFMTIDPKLAIKNFNADHIWMGSSESSRIADYIVETLQNKH